MTHREQKKLIREAWGQVAYVLDNLTWGGIGRNYLKENIQEERAHDRFRGESIQRGMTIKEAGKMFAVKQLADLLTGKAGEPPVKEYLHYRKSVYTAYAIFATYEKELREAWRDIDLEALTLLDYCELIKDPRDGAVLSDREVEK